MKCKGCRWCTLLHYPEDDSPNWLHYCSSRSFWNEDDTIGQSYERCKGRYYEPKD